MPHGTWEEGAPVDVFLCCGGGPQAHGQVRDSHPPWGPRAAWWREDRLSAAVRGLSSAKTRAEGGQESLLFISPSLVLWAGAQCHPHVSYYFTRLPSKRQASRVGPLMSGPSLPPPWGRSVFAEDQEGSQAETVPRPSPPDVLPRLQSRWDHRLLEGEWRSHPAWPRSL